MNLKQIFLVVALAWFSFNAQSQVSHGLSLTLIGPEPDSLVIGQQYDIFATLTNNDSVAFFGVIDFSMRNDNGPIPQDSTIFGKPPYSGSQIALNPQESIPAYFRIVVSPDYFLVPGPETIVIWPISNKPVKDSLIISTNIHPNPNNISEQRSPSFYYFQQNKWLYIKELQLNISLEKVRIMSLDGRLILEENYSGKPIDLTGLNNGLYLLEIKDRTGKSSVVKFVN